MSAIGPGLVDGYFGQHHIPEPNSGCWLWTGAVSDRGYGLIQRRAYKGYAHRFSYRTFRGPIPRGMDVCHRCDTPSCVNPDHLFVGSRADNMQDCIRKGRHVSQSGFVYAHGGAHPRAVLSDQDVAAIIAARGAATWKQIAGRYGVSRETVKSIMLGKSWTHVSRDIVAKPKVDA